MKNFVIIVLIILGSSCNRTNRGEVGNAAIKFSSDFVTENNMSSPNWKVKGKEILKNEGDSIYYVSGTVEGFSSFNMPVTVKKFNETLHYLGGDANNRKNWKCLEINIDGRRIK